MAYTFPSLHVVSALANTTTHHHHTFYSPHREIARTSCIILFGYSTRTPNDDILKNGNSIQLRTIGEPVLRNGSTNELHFQVGLSENESICTKEDSRLKNEACSTLLHNRKGIGYYLQGTTELSIFNCHSHSKCFACFGRRREIIKLILHLFFPFLLCDYHCKTMRIAVY